MFCDLLAIKDKNRCQLKLNRGTLIHNHSTSDWKSKHSDKSCSKVSIMIIFLQHLQSSVLKPNQHPLMGLWRNRQFFSINMPHSGLMKNGYFLIILSWKNKNFLMSVTTTPDYSQCKIEHNKRKEFETLQKFLICLDRSTLVVL